MACLKTTPSPTHLNPSVPDAFPVRFCLPSHLFPSAATPPSASSISPSLSTGFSCFSRIFKTCRSSARLSLFPIFHTQDRFIHPCLLLLILRPECPPFGLCTSSNSFFEFFLSPTHFPRVGRSCCRYRRFATFPVCCHSSLARPSISSPSPCAVHSVPGARCCIPTEACAVFCHT